jgi:hypothetical protein
MTAIRRKRDDDSSHNVNSSQCSDSLAFDASSMSQADEYYSRRRTKRRRTIVDQLQQINLDREDVDVPDQILDRVVVDDNSLTSSEAGEEEDDDDQPDASQLLLSDVEKAQRALMLELVFGPGSGSSSGGGRATTTRTRTTTTPVGLASLVAANPVDRKIETLIRESVQKVANGEAPLPGLAPPVQKDDMFIEPSYTRPTTSDEFHWATRRRQRSNSLPSMELDGEAATSSMELS